MNPSAVQGHLAINNGIIPPPRPYFKNRRPAAVPKGQFLRNSISSLSPADLINGLKNMNLTDESCTTEAETFEEMNLFPEILKGIYDMGYEKPAQCQKKIILPVMNGRDIVCQAQSGMGKTAAYTIGILQKIDVKQKNVQALILTPTRELAEQAAEVFASLGKYMQGLHIATTIGGTRMKRDILNLLENPQIIIGTCGRVADHFQKRRINTSTIRTFVLDEADKMIIDPSFRPDLQFIMHSIPGDTQLILASATMPEPILRKAQREFLRNPLLVLIPNEELTLQGIRQYYVKLDTLEQKIDTLAELFPSMGTKKGLIFCNTRSGAEDLNRRLLIALNDRRVAGIVGTMEQYTRKSTLDSFKSGVVNYLVSSDLLGRGIDVQQVQVVVNFELPSRKEEYIHRVGRAGRFGRKGVAITFVLNKPMDERRLTEIEEFYRTRIEELPNRIGDVFNI